MNIQKSVSMHLKQSKEDNMETNNKMRYFILSDVDKINIQSKVLTKGE